MTAPKLRNDVVNFSAEVEVNPYLMGNYSPIDTEITATDLEVIGEIPKDLNGMYVRNGPNPKYQPKGRYHWFDGDGMLHAVRIKDGQVTYRNRYIKTEGHEREVHAGGVLWSGIMEPPHENPRLNVHMPVKDTANTSIDYFNGELIATWYLAGEPYAIDPETLETLGKMDFGGTMSERTNMSAHCKVDENSNEMLFFDYSPRPPYMMYGVVGSNGHVKHVVPIDLPGPRMPHDMAISTNYSILMDLPLIADPEAAKAGRHKILFDRSMPARFGIIPRYGESDSIRWFEAKPCYMYHTINAWEEGDEIIMDCCRVNHPAPPPGAVTRLEKMLGYLRLDAQIYRYRFNLRTGQTIEEELDDLNTEFPSMNSAVLGRKSRYAYNVSITADRTLLFDGLVKYDTERGTSQRFAFGDGRYGSEAPFAPLENATSEDDGYLLSFLYDERESQSELLILDAQNITDEPLARVIIPQRIPHGFHACWVPGEKLN